jgi:Antitoxin VbhA
VELREKVARREAVDSALGSVAAEGLVPTDGFARDAHEFAEGVIDADELVRRAIERHRRCG